MSDEAKKLPDANLDVLAAKLWNAAKVPKAYLEYIGGVPVLPPLAGMSVKPQVCEDSAPEQNHTMEYIVPDSPPDHVFTCLTLPPEFAWRMWRVYRDTTTLWEGIDYKVDSDRRRIVFAESLKEGMRIQVTTIGEKLKKFGATLGSKGCDSDSPA